LKTRDVVIFSGDEFVVPQNIQRIDSDTTHGWQVRYHGTKFFSDGSPDGSGAAKALERATRELVARVATMPAPVTLRRQPSPNKTSDLPAGISGPILADRNGTQAAVIQVSIPRYGKEAQVKRIHIGTPRTYRKARFKAAVARAVEMRNEALANYEADATRARRKAVAAAAAATGKALRAARAGT
jgi:hypothetical protein